MHAPFEKTNPIHTQFGGASRHPAHQNLKGKQKNTVDPVILSNYWKKQSQFGDLPLRAPSSQRINIDKSDEKIIKPNNRVLCDLCG